MHSCAACFSQNADRSIRGHRFADALIVLEQAVTALPALPVEPELSLVISILARAGSCAIKQKKLDTAEGHIKLGLALCGGLRLNATYEDAYLFEALSALLCASAALSQEKLN